MLKLIIHLHQVSDIYQAMVDHIYNMGDDYYHTIAYLDLDTLDIQYILSSLINATEEIAKPLAEITEKDLSTEIDSDGLDLYKKIDLELRTKYVRLPEIEGWHGYNDMQAYIDQEEDSTLARKLNRSIQGKGAFGRFKEVLYHYPGKIEEWYHFEAMHQFERIREWLHEVDLELELIIE